MNNQPSFNEEMPPIRQEEVKIPEGEIELKGTMFYPNEMKEKNPATLFVHGWMSKQDKTFDIAEALARNGEMSLLFNLREHGIENGNPNSCSRNDFLNDATAAYDYLISQKGVDPDQITFMGTSMGAYLAAILSSKRKAERLMFRVPADYKDEGFNEPGIRGAKYPDVKEWRARIRNFDESAALKSIHDFDGEMLIIESGMDEDIPHETIQSYMNAVKDPTKVSHVLMPDATHSIRTEDAPKKKFLRDSILNWRFHKE